MERRGNFGRSLRKMAAASSGGRTVDISVPPSPWQQSEQTVAAVPLVTQNPSLLVIRLVFAALKIYTRPSFPAQAEYLGGSVRWTHPPICPPPRSFAISSVGFLSPANVAQRCYYQTSFA